MNIAHKTLIHAVILIILAPFLNGCAGVKPFPNTARAGDTIVLAPGWDRSFKRQDLTVTITDASGQQYVLPPGDAAIRAIVNLYPDPLSYLVVGTRMGLATADYNYGAIYGKTINFNLTDDDPDWWQTSVFLDLPAALTTGVANISFQSANGDTYGPIPVEIIPGEGMPNAFMADMGEVDPIQLQSLERAPHFVVHLAGGDVVPAAIEVVLTHDPSAAVGGHGRPLAVNPRGEMKSLFWGDDGTTMKVMMMAGGGNTSYLRKYKFTYFKFYVSGGITGLAISDVKAYDADGNQISGITASVE